MNTALFENKYRIKSTRLKGWDYSEDGLYYVTICTKDRQCYFGDIREGKMTLSETGVITQKYWLGIPKHYPNVKLDEYAVMPNHIHGIVMIDRNGNRIGGNGCNGRRDAINRVSTLTNTTSGGITMAHNPMLCRHSLSNIIRWFKGRVTFEIHKSQKNCSFHWQPRFYDHIIRNEESLNKIREYIYNNPLKWDLDKNNPKNAGKDAINRVSTQHA